MSKVSVKTNGAGKIKSGTKLKSKKHSLEIRGARKENLNGNEAVRKNGQTSRRLNVHNEADEDEDEDAQRTAMEAFKRNFEKQFGMVEMGKEISEKDAGRSESSSSGSDSESESESVSDSDNAYDVMSSKTPTAQVPSDDSESESDAPQVVKFTGLSSHTQSVPSKRDKRKFMTSTAPKIAETQPKKKVKMSKKEQEEEQEDLKNDLALQRLIQESHILAGSQAHGYYSGADISSEFDNPIGKARLKVMSSRLNHLGIKDKQDKIPMLAQRHRTNRTKTMKEEYEKYALENGIVMAKSTNNEQPKKKPKKRDFGLKVSSVGRETQYGLKLSKKDIARISRK